MKHSNILAMLDVVSALDLWIGAVFANEEKVLALCVGEGYEFYTLTGVSFDCKNAHIYYYNDDGEHFHDQVEIENLIEEGVLQ